MRQFLCFDLAGHHNAPLTGPLSASAKVLHYKDEIRGASSSNGIQLSERQCWERRRPACHERRRREPESRYDAAWPEGRR